jgi:pyruvate dehydrogenase E2 component (dihydrolipoamide acetyltransferase)
MPFMLTMPKLSPTMTEGTISKWRKKEGEFVKDGETLLEIATDKATVEHAVLDGGFIRKILVQEGQEAEVNQAIAIFTKHKDESIDGFEVVKEKVEISTALVNEEIRKDMELKEPCSKDAVNMGMDLGAFALQPAYEVDVFDSIDDKGRVKASPLAKKLAKENQLDLTTVQGTGPKGLVTSNDLEHAQKDTSLVFGSKRQPSVPSGSYDTLALTPIRKKIAKRLQQAKTFIPHFYISLEIDAEPLHNLREELKATDVKLTFNDFILKACSIALKQHPEINSGFDVVSQSIVRFNSIDISVAVSIDGGLITPIIRHADYKNLGQISKEVKVLADKARQQKLKAHEYQGGSFTVSNLGMYGIDYFAAIINPPQAAILAVGGVLEKPIVKNGFVVPGKVLTLTLSLDHRVLDGAIGAQFLKTLQKLLEHPSCLLIH